MAHIQFPVVGARPLPMNGQPTAKAFSWEAALSEGRALCEQLDVNRARMRFRELLALIYPGYTSIELARSACNRHADHLLEDSVELEGHSFESRHLRDTAMDCIAALSPVEATEVLQDFEATLIAYERDSIIEWEAEFMRKGGVANGEWVTSLFSEALVRRGDPTPWVSAGEVVQRTTDAIERMTFSGFCLTHQEAARWLWEHVAFAHGVPVDSAVAFLQALQPHGVQPLTPPDGSKMAELAQTYTLRSIAANWTAATVDLQMTQLIDRAAPADGQPAVKSRRPRIV